MKTLRLLATVIAFLTCTFLLRAEIRTGRCGESLTYTLDTESGVLKIEGSGAMTDFNESLSYHASPLPWYDYRDLILAAELPAGLSRIGVYAFYGCSGLTSITIPNSVTSIGDEAFYG